MGRRVVTADRRSRPQKLRDLDWFWHTGQMRGDAQREPGIGNRLKPVGGVLVVGGIVVPECQPFRILRVKPLMDMRLLVGVMLFADAKLVNMSRRSFDESQQQG